MSNSSEGAFEYPDLLGMITGGLRLNVQALQVAAATYPRIAAVGQPFESLILLQNACDKQIAVRVTLRLPRKDAGSGRANIVTPKDNLTLNMQAGEVGLLHMPLVALQPTQPNSQLQIGVKIEVSVPRGARQIRSPEGGRVASVLNMSPVRLNILREAGFLTDVIDGHLVDTVNIAPGQIMAAPPEKSPRYEVLWSVKDLPMERRKFEEMGEQAVKFAGTITRYQVYQPLIQATEMRFAQAGLPLHPAECIFIAKTLTYVMEDGLEIEPGTSLQGSRWFQQLMGVMSDEELLKDPDRLVQYLYSALIYDGVMLGLSMTERNSGESLGSTAEHVSYANEIVAAIDNKAPIDLSHAYLPLILTGLLLNPTIRNSRENPWVSLTQIREAWRGRLKLADNRYEWVANIFSNFAYKCESALNDARIPKPSTGPLPGTGSLRTPSGA